MIPRDDDGMDRNARLPSAPAWSTAPAPAAPASGAMPATLGPDAQAAALFREEFEVRRREAQAQQMDQAAALRALADRERAARRAQGVGAVSLVDTAVRWGLIGLVVGAAARAVTRPRRTP